MPDLLDLLPPERGNTVMVLGGEIDIRQLTARVLAQLMRRFPELAKAFFAEGMPEHLRGVATLEAWPAIVAAGTGHLGDEAYEAAIERRLPQAEMIRLGQAILALSNPRPEQEEGKDPLSEAVLVAAEPEQTSSPLPSSS